jgi:hypothetical protein
MAHILPKCRHGGQERHGQDFTAALHLPISHQWNMACPINQTTGEPDHVAAPEWRW